MNRVSLFTGRNWLLERRKSIAWFGFRSWKNLVDLVLVIFYDPTFRSKCNGLRRANFWEIKNKRWNYLQWPEKFSPSVLETIRRQDAVGFTDGALTIGVFAG